MNPARPKGNPPTIVADDEGGATLNDDLHLTAKDIARLLATTGRRVSPAKARMLRYPVKASVNAS